MPTTVPNRPSNGLIEAIVPKVVRNRPKSCETARPTSSTDSFITSGGLLMFFKPAAKMRPNGELAASLVSMPSLTPRCLSSLMTSSSRAGGAMRWLRKNIERSMIKPSAMMDARIKNQIGQPAASTIAYTRVLQMCLNYQAATLACRTELSNLSQDLLQHYFAKLPFEKSISVYSQNLWITLWMTLGDLSLIHISEPT